MTDTALSNALVPPLDRETKNWKTFIFLFIEQTQLLDVWMLFYAITYVRRPQIISFDTMAVPLDSCIVGLWHPKKPKKFVFKSVKNANFWRKYEIILPRKNLPIWDPNLPLRNPKSPYLALRKYHMYENCKSSIHPNLLKNW